MLRVAGLTVLTLVAFAANSVLCRMALAPSHIDPVAFTVIRLGSGALALSLLVRLIREGGAAGVGAATGTVPASGEGPAKQTGAPADPALLPAAGAASVLQFGSWASALALFVYAMAFSWAYVSLQAGTGALILFAAVQATMIAAALWSGERPGLLQWLGFAMAILGLLYLLLPGLAAPDPLGAALMFASGVAWGLYSLHGRGKSAPVAQTAGNFVRTVPFAVLAMGVAHGSLHAERPGVLLAITSGAVTSGLGYVLWYMVLPGLTVTRAAVVQLAVPLLAALGGVVFVGEPFTRRLAFSSVLILGGLALAIVARGAPAIPRPGPR